MVRTNVEAVVDLCTLFVPGMVTRHRGAVLNTASTAAFQPLPGQAALRRLQGLRPVLRARARGRAARHGGHGHHACAPGPVETGFAEAAGMTDEEAAESLPKFMWVPAADVAKAAVDGLAAGRPVVIPGAANRAAAALAHLTPKALILPLLVQRHPSLQEPG